MQTEKLNSTISAFLAEHALSLSGLAVLTEIPLPRLSELTAGAESTIAEAARLASVLGGEPQDYAPGLQADLWFQAQSPEVQAETLRLLKELEERQEARSLRLDRISQFARRSIVAAAIVVVGALGYAGWKDHQVHGIRREAYRYACRIYGDRDAALGLAGQELAREAQAKVLALADVVEVNIGDPGERARIQSFCLDLCRYYASIGAQYQMRTKRAQYLATAPKEARDRNIVFDTLTGQLIDVERYDGGRLDLAAIKTAVSAEMRIQQGLDMAGRIARGEVKLADLPPLEDWGRAANTPSVYGGREK